MGYKKGKERGLEEKNKKRLIARERKREREKKVMMISEREKEEKILRRKGK